MGIAWRELNVLNDLVVRIVGIEFQRPPGAALAVIKIDVPSRVSRNVSMNLFSNSS